MNDVTMTLQADHLILEALKEDISSEDVTTNAVMKEAVKGEVELICKEDGIIAGLHVFKRVFELLDSQDKLAELTYQTRFAAMQAGINLTGDPTEWKKQLAALKDVPKEITDAVDKTVAAKGAVEAARTAFFEVYENRKLRVSDCLLYTSRCV